MRKKKAAQMVKTDWEKAYGDILKECQEVSLERSKGQVEISDLKMMVVNQDRRIDRLINTLENFSGK